MRQTCTLIILFFSIACNRPAVQKNDITKIEIATGYCWGHCQKTAVSIDSSLNYKYYGGDGDEGDYSGWIPDSAAAYKRSRLHGYYCGKISKAFWDTLNNRMNAIYYQKMDTTYTPANDDQRLEIIIHYKGTAKHITGSLLGFRPKVTDVFGWIINSYREIKPCAFNGVLRFETTLQNGMHKKRSLPVTN